MRWRTRQIVATISYDRLGEYKRQTNLAKNGLDFAYAYLVYENPYKITLPTPRGSEMRELDVAVVDLVGSALALIYARRDADV